MGACAAPTRLDRDPIRRPVPPLPPLPTMANPPPTVLPRIQASAESRSVPPASTAPSSSVPLPPSAGDATTMRQAQEALQQSYQFTGLSDSQLAQQKSAEALLVQGQSKPALQALQRLNQELRTGNKSYVVKSGDSLWVISGKSEVYGNPWLWPLIWQSNLQVLPNPDKLAAGQQLKIRPNPTIQEVVDAVTYAREKNQRSETRIGEIQESGKP